MVLGYNMMFMIFLFISLMVYFLVCYYIMRLVVLFGVINMYIESVIIVVIDI